MNVVEKGRIKVERKCREEETVTRLVRWGKSNPESVEEAGRRVNVGQVEVKEDSGRTNQQKKEGQFCS